MSCVAVVAIRNVGMTVPYVYNLQLCSIQPLQLVCKAAETVHKALSSVKSCVFDGIIHFDCSCFCIVSLLQADDQNKCTHVMAMLTSNGHTGRHTVHFGLSTDITTQAIMCGVDCGWEQGSASTCLQRLLPICMMDTLEIGVMA